MSEEELRAAGSDSDDDFDWEEVEVPQNVADEGISIDLEDHASSSNILLRDIEITIHARPKKDEAAKKRAAEIQAQRAMRLDCHKAHTICLIANASVRNKWINDELLHARLMSLTPMTLQSAFFISKAKVPEAPMRGRMFEAAVTRLAEWWQATFEVEPTGHMRSRTFEEVQAQLSANRKGKGRARDSDDESSSDEYETIRSEKSLMKRALIRKGSRDISAQLFTALCRALGIPARLVVSLQSVPWQAGVGKPKPGYRKSKNKGGREGARFRDNGNDNDDDEDMEQGSTPDSPASSTVGRTAQKGEISNSRKGKIREVPPINLTRVLRPPDPRTTPPVFWTEVFSRADGRWLPVDPIRCITNKRKAFDPSPSLNTNRAGRDAKVRVENRMVYVIAFEEDGYARDVTPRYAREYGAKVSKVQQGGKGRKRWWEQVMGMITRPYRLNRDDVEDEELHNNQLTEQMPTTLSGFKNHPLYVLTRHLKRDEVIYPLVELGKFRGEPVYPRSSVVALKAAENWMRQGRKVLEGCQPLKWVKQRAVTVNKKRALEFAKGGLSTERSGAEIMQGLYSYDQTELYRANSVVDGKVPKNEFGNIDLYVPSMLPPGGAYIPHKGAAKVSRQLGFDFAEAVTNFEFRKGRAFPMITGIVVAAENEDAVLEAYWAAEQDAEKKRVAKRQEQVLKRWYRLVQGLKIRQRLLEQYADRGGDQADHVIEIKTPVQEAGGFLLGADDIVQPYTLPRDLHEQTDTFPDGGAEVARSRSEDDDGAPDLVAPPDIESHQQQDEDMFDEGIQQTIPTIPKSMRELAEAGNSGNKLAENASKMEPLLASMALTPGVTPTTSLRSKEKSKGGRASSKTNTSVALASPSLEGGRIGNASRRVSKKRGRRETGDSEPEVEEVSEVELRPRSVKRARPEPAVKSDRVLRPRLAKS